MDVNIYGAVMPHMLDDPGLGLTPATAGTIGSWTTFGMLLGGAPVANGMQDWGFTAFAVAGLCGAAAISLVPLMARRGNRGAGAGAAAATVTA